jgi:hypothetical protein
MNLCGVSAHINAVCCRLLPCMSVSHSMIVYSPDNNMSCCRLDISRLPFNAALVHTVTLWQSDVTSHNPVLVLHHVLLLDHEQLAYQLCREAIHRSCQTHNVTLAEPLWCPALRFVRRLPVLLSALGPAAPHHSAHASAA